MDGIIYSTEGPKSARRKENTQHINQPLRNQLSLNEFPPAGSVGSFADNDHSVSSTAIGFAGYMRNTKSRDNQLMAKKIAKINNLALTQM